MALSGGLMIVGGLIAGGGLRNPKPKEPREAPRAAPAGDCGHCPPAEEPVTVRREGEPVGETV
jgi:hypothetical protein